MKVELLYNTPLWVCAKAIRKCWSSEDKSDSYYSWNNISLTECDMTTADKEAIHCGEKDKALIDRVGNQNKHSSTLEHLVYTFDIDGISRACLQELARHRMASYSVKSTRYTLKELKDEYIEIKISFSYGNRDIIFDKDIVGKYIVLTGNPYIDGHSAEALKNTQQLLQYGVDSNDKIKYTIPEAYKTSLVMTINMRSLQSMLKLRLNKSALWEFNQLCIKIVQALPEEHLYLIEDIVKEQINGNERVAELKSLFN